VNRDYDTWEGRVEKIGKLIGYKELEVMNEIGNGRNATVYLGKYRGNIVAVKIAGMHVQMEEIVKEFEIMVRLSNIERVVKVLGMCVSKKAIVMECLQGSLEDIVRNRTDALTRKQKLRIGLQIALTMQQVHEQGIIHRDLIISNILVDYNFEVKIADFGIALAQENCGNFVGHPRYCAPEIISQLQYSYELDVYYFGTVFYELITDLAFFGHILEDEMVVKKVAAGDRPQIPEHCPPTVSNLLCRCLGSQEERPTFAQIAIELASYLESTS